MKIQVLRSVMLALVVTALALTGCKKNDTPVSTGGGTTPDANSVSGTITFLYNGNPIDASHWPFSATATDPFPGFIRISLVPATAAGQATGGPAGIIGANPSGVKFTDLTAGVLNYKFANIPNGTYLVNAAFFDPITGKSQTVLGYVGQITPYQFGTPITITNNQGVANVNMVADVALAYNTIAADRRSTTVSPTGTFFGSVKVDSASLSKWPTGNPFTGNPTTAVYLAVIGYKSTNPPGTSTTGPDLFVYLPKPTVGNIAVFADTTHTMPMGTTYNNIQVNVYKGYAPEYPNAAPLATMKSASGADSVKVSSGQYQVVWHSTVTLP
jgi:hypothetical protein